MNTQNSTWFVTGTSSGIGRALTRTLLERGDRVAATLRRPEALDDLAAIHGERLWTAALDVTDPAAVRTTIDRAFDALGRIDVVVNNAAYALVGAAEACSDAQIRRQIETNLFGSIGVVRAALPHLRAQGGGRIVQISSEGGQVAYPAFGYYHATKWGIEGFLESVAQEIAPFGIEVTIVEPGTVATNFGAGIVCPEPLAAYAGTPADEVGRAVANRSFPIVGDPMKMAREIVAGAHRTPAAKRIVLGSDAFEHVRTALRARLRELDAQEELARSTDIAAAPPAARA